MASHCLSLTDPFFLDAHTAQEIDKEQGTHIRRVLSDMKTYTMEFDLEKRVAKPPRCFVREFGDTIAPYVIFRDPNGNELEIHVTKKHRKIYFEDGWHDLKDIYEIPFGAWVSFTYINPKLLAIRVTTRWGQEVKYPAKSPPLRRMLTNVRVDAVFGSSPLLTGRSARLRPKTFVRTYVKEMTSYDINSGTLILPWYGFGDSAFAFAFSSLVFVDSRSTHFHCTLDFSVDAAGQMCCKVSNGWIDVCKSHGLVEGDKVRFCVTRLARDCVIYLYVYPQIGTETTINYPLNDGSQIPLYISQHHFVTFG